jgi:hypothetical protein
MDPSRLFTNFWHMIPQTLTGLPPPTYRNDGVAPPPLKNTIHPLVVVTPQQCRAMQTKSPLAITISSTVLERDLCMIKE